MDILFHNAHGRKVIAEFDGQAIRQLDPSEKIHLREVDDEGNLPSECVYCKTLFGGGRVAWMTSREKWEGRKDRCL